MATLKSKSAAPVKTAAELVADVLASARTSSANVRYSIPESATRGNCADGTQVALGTLASGKLAGREELVHVNGTSRVGMPYHVVLTAIRDGVIPADIIRALVN